MEEKVALMTELDNAAEIEEKYLSLQSQVRELQQEKEQLELVLQDMQKHNPKVNAK